MANKSDIDSGEFGSLRAETLVKERVSSVQKNVSRTTRKRMNADQFSPSEGTLIKMRKQNSIAEDFTANSSTADTDLSNLETEWNSSVEKHDSSVEKEMSIADLPVEMLEQILQNVNITDLLNCRQINRHWNEIASSIVRKRNDELHFRFHGGHFVQNFDRRSHLECVSNKHRFIGREFHQCSVRPLLGSNLSELVDCLKESKNFPCASFHFNELNNFEMEEMKNFLSIWGQDIHSLNVDLKDPLNSVGILQTLLLEKVPNLKKLEIKFRPNGYTYGEIITPSSVRLFDNRNEFQLPQLEVLCVNGSFREFRGIVEDLLVAASNLKKFELKRMTHFFYRETMIDEYNVSESITASDLAMLESANKLKCLKNMRIDLSVDLIEFLENSTRLDDLKLEALAISLHPSVWQNEKLKSRATATVNQLFHSNNEIIQTLAITPMGCLPALIIPRMKNLKKLDLWGFAKGRRDEDYAMIPTIKATFPPLFEMADNFPNLKELESHLLCADVHFPTSIKPMTNVEVLRIFISYESIRSTESHAKLMKATPNVKTLLLVDSFDLEMDSTFTERFRAIPNHLTKLVNFGWIIDRPFRNNLLHSLDAAITGLPAEFCKEWLEKFRTEQHLPGDLVSYQLKRTQSSILDLKELKKLEIYFRFDMYGMGNYVDEDDIQIGYNLDPKYYKTGLTKVSEFLAFNLMPNLKTEITRDIWV